MLDSHSTSSSLTLFFRRCSGIAAAANAELLDCSLLSCVLTSLPASIGEGRAPPELLLGAPLTSLTSTGGGAAIAGAAPTPPAITGAGVLGAFLSKNVLILPSSSATASMILCLHSSLCRPLNLAPLDTNEHSFATKCPHRASQCAI